MTTQPTKTALHITLASLRQRGACKSGYNTLAAHLGADWPDDKPINLLSCLDSNPVEDVIWALRATLENSDYAARMIAADCAESVLHIYESAYANDRRPRDAVEAARAFARGEIDDATGAAWAAGDAAGDAARAARAAAWAAEAAWAAWVAEDAAGDAWAAEKAKQAEILRKWLTEE